MKFETFVTGESNREAYAAAEAVAAFPGSTYDPLYIYGGFGMGKTHLLQAAAWRAAEIDPRLKVKYVTAEQVIDDVILAKGDLDIDGFQDKYLGYDMLLIDDVQHLAEQDTAVFVTKFCIREYCLDHKQVIMAGRQPLDEDQEQLFRKMDIRCRAVELLKPEPALRENILRNIAKRIGLEVDEDVEAVIKLISENKDNNVRELEGAFNKVIVLSQIMKTDINVEEAKFLLGI